MCGYFYLVELREVGCVIVPTCTAAAFLAFFCQYSYNSLATLHDSNAFYNPKDTVIVFLFGSFVLVEFCDVAFVIVPSFVAFGFFGISLPIKIRQPRNLVQ
jgi:hypothetical protein